jgi:ATP-dependent protease ClpP protease subunit
VNWNYTIDPNAETPIMLINKHIGYDEQAGPGIMGDQFQMELLTLDAMGKRNIHVWINSEGGSVKRWGENLLSNS